MDLKQEKAYFSNLNLKPKKQKAPIV